MADIKKFLDQEGVSTLWSRISEELTAKQNEINSTRELVEQNAEDIETMQGQISALEAGTYDDSALKGLIATAQSGVNDNAAALALLNKNANTNGSVRNIATTIAATEVAKIVAGANASFDTLKEIADWIQNDTIGATDMANNIAALQDLVGNTAVATQISTALNNALKLNGSDRYALASELIDAANRISALEKAGYMTETAVNTTINNKIAALKLSETYDAKGSAASALANAKVYTDVEFGKIQALTQAEINAAIAAIV